MKLPQLIITGLAVVLLSVAASAQDKTAEKEKDSKAAEVAATTSSSTAATSSSSTATKKPAPAHAKYIGGGKTFDGLIPMYQKGGKLYAELSSSHYKNEYLILISIARGIGQGQILGGMSWGFGDDWVWAFRKIDDRVYVIRKNVRFKAKSGSPESSALKNAYTDSVLFSIKIAAKGPKGGDLIELNSIFMSDLPQISRQLPGFAFSSTKSTWGKVKGFKDNMELEVDATYASSGRLDIDTVPDSRGVSIAVHYSISKIPTSGYTPRLADDRIGYFLTVRKDYSKNSDRTQFVRYVNRWNLQKADASADLSPPKKPLIFWIEKTVPFKYRKPIRDGIAEWNKAFEKAGFIDAIEVRQQPDNADWDPEDINYNTFRWITSSAGFAMGPSRVNPYTGQILDADIIFDADFLTFWKQEFETMTPADVASLTGGSLNPDDYLPGALHALGLDHRCMLQHGMAQQFALGASAAMARADAKEVAKLQEKLIMQGLKEVTMHEVGHTLGLRHNFKASRFLSLEEINDPKKTRQSGMVASVMDYSPSNISPKGQPQGDFYTTTIGPYDYWAIEYGYKPFSGGTKGETKELTKIAARSGEKGLAYATDENTRGIDPDPDSNRFDLGNDPVKYAMARAKISKELIDGLVDRMTKKGDDYTQARRAFNILLSTRGQAMSFVARTVGGMRLSRSHKGDKDGKPPVSTIDPKEQRAALDFLQKEVFAANAFQFPPELFSYLGSSKWRHWGLSNSTRPDFGIHDNVAMWQDRVLDQLLSRMTLERIYDTELKVPADQDAFTTAELIEKLTASTFSEVSSIKDGQFSNRQPAINSLRRNLQRRYLRRLANLAMGRTSAPADCKTVAFAELGSLQAKIDTLLKGNVKLDSYTRAHLQESSARIGKVLEAQLTLSSP